MSGHRRSRHWIILSAAVGHAIFPPPPHSTPLAGVPDLAGRHDLCWRIIGYLFQACLLALKYASDALREIATLLMGGMWGATWQVILFLFSIVLVCFLLVGRRAWDLDTISSRGDFSRNMGINVDRFRIVGILVVSFAAAV